MLYFPQYPGAEEKLCAIYEKHNKSKKLKLKEVGFPGKSFNLAYSGDKTCLVLEDWIDFKARDYTWLFDPEIVAVGKGADGLRVYHPNWGVLTTNKDNLGVNGYSLSPILTNELFGLYLLQGEATFSCIGNFDFLGVHKASNLWQKKHEDPIKTVLDHIIFNSRGLDIKDPSISLFMLRQIEICCNLLYRKISKNMDISSNNGDQIQQIITFIPQIGYGMLMHQANTVNAQKNSVYSIFGLKFCQEVLNHLLDTHTKLLAHYSK